ncbi:hypothetical protein [Portibacter marinus]|uniref:hypothetical protein n=1 Tax=Portibacter marinus TaxID=2898660 RepID=UPI001F2494F9|nr:hypothetical protein [Portibacter marinus]
MRELFVFIFLCTVFVSCEIPSRTTADFVFIEIDEMLLEGQDSGFKDVWFYQDGQIQGVYELPQKIPVVNDDPLNVVFQAGIRENGINSMPRIYPFATQIEQSLNIEEGTTISIIPEFNYLPGTKIRINATFENDVAFSKDEDGSVQTSLALVNGKGEITLEPGQIFEASTDLVFSGIPRDGSPVFVEVEYQGNADLKVGLVGVVANDSFKEYFVSLRSENNWKKAFINLTDLVIASALDGYRVLIGVDNNQGNDPVNVFVDNIKLLHF